MYGPHREKESEVSELLSRLGTLTPREREVMGKVITGALNKQIAARLAISEKTVKVHRARVMQKMKAGSVAELVLMAKKTGISAS